MLRVIWEVRHLFAKSDILYGAGSWWGVGGLSRKEGFWEYSMKGKQSYGRWEVVGKWQDTCGGGGGEEEDEDE